MRIITINLPEKYLSAIQCLNDLGIYPSRSEAIRIALRNFLHEELKMDQDLGDDIFKDLIKRSRDEPEKPISKPLDVKIISEESKISPIKPTKSPKTIKQMEKPGTLYKIFHGELFFNYIISYLKESEIPMNTNELAEKLKLDCSTVSAGLKKLMKRSPGLVKPQKRRTKEGNLRWYFSLNESSFNQLQVEVYQN